MPTFVLAYLVTLALFAVIDFAWLGLAARSFYTAQLGEKLRPQPGPGRRRPVLPGLCRGPDLLRRTPRPAWRRLDSETLGLGTFLGFVAYATYDLTNQATLKDWPLLVTVVDLAWGTVLSAVVAAGCLCAAFS